MAVNILQQIVETFKMQTSQNSTRYCVIVCVYVGSTCGSVFAGVFYISHMMKNFKILMDLDFAKNSNKTN